MPAYANAYRLTARMSTGAMGATLVTGGGGGGPDGGSATRGAAAPRAGAVAPCVFGYAYARIRECISTYLRLPLRQRKRERLQRLGRPPRAAAPSAAGMGHRGRRRRQRGRRAPVERARANEPTHIAAPRGGCRAAAAVARACIGCIRPHAIMHFVMLAFAQR